MASRFCLRFRSRFYSTLSQFSVHRGSPFIAIPESLLITSPSPNLRVIPVEFPFSSAGIRYLSTLSRQPVRKRTVDIGARARQLQNRRLWTYALTFSCIAGFIVIVLNNFQDQLVFYVTPTDAMEKYSINPSKNKFRLGGLVLEGSVTQPASSPEMEFVVTDLITDILVRYQGSLPDLFREGHSVVVEGFVRPFGEEPKEKLASTGRRVSAKALSGDCYFAATEVLAKHDEKYMPQEVAAAIEKNKAKIEAKAEAEAEAEQGRVRVT
ncbi:cytochrome c-type biogenesis protein CcmE homolog, mitochondrial [Telopea speciosissima]|uniref:cytochrome c-type biogenesis protein CcmE homolog, mitochondrial n=1 Tax=Telopea speciosissima TaxID=54955 RepID=UPI001CC55242|nr:cytochrome c-type biogenesis protein CcmE homolog, mitochondrial [Telopea speciosissima]